MSKSSNNLPAELTGSNAPAGAPEAMTQSTEDIAAAEKKAAEEKAAAEKKAAADKAAADKKAAAEQKKADKDAKAEAEQAAAVKAATNVPSDAMLQRIENNAAAQINASEKVTIFISPTSKTDKRAEVCINGHWWKIKKGEWVSVPQDVATVLRQSEQVLEENERLKGELMVFH